MKDELKRPYDNRPSLIVYMILRVLIILAAVRAVFRGEYENVFLCILSLVLLLLPSILSHRLDVKLPGSSFCFSFSLRKFWGKSTAFMSVFPIGIPCCTPSTAFCVQRWDLPWWI